MSCYQLSKKSGIPWATIADIHLGRIRLDQCDTRTLFNLSKALGLQIEELLELEIEQEENTVIMKPSGDTYLETGLPESIQKAIKDYLLGEREQVLYLDCLWGELYGAINSNMWAGLITEEQADYLREEYLGIEPRRRMAEYII